MHYFINFNLKYLCIFETEKVAVWFFSTELKSKHLGKNDVKKLVSMTEHTQTDIEIATQAILSPPLSM